MDSGESFEIKNTVKIAINHNMNYKLELARRIEESVSHTQCYECKGFHSVNVELDEDGNYKDAHFDEGTCEGFKTNYKKSIRVAFVTGIPIFPL